MAQRVAVCISGRGSNLAALLAALGPDAPAEVVLVISNRAAAGGLETARAHGIATHVLADAGDPAEWLAVLSRHRVDLVVLAGFLALVPAGVVRELAGRMINIHPSLLPSFKGLDTHRRALEAGVRVAGCTVHFVSAEMDAGPIIGQAAVPVLPGDTPDGLAARVLQAEHRLYPRMLALVAANKVSTDGPVVRWQDTGNIEINQTNTLLSP